MNKKWLTIGVGFAILVALGANWLWARREVEPGNRGFVAAIWQEPKSTRRYRDRLGMAVSARRAAMSCGTVECVLAILGPPDNFLRGQSAWEVWCTDATEGGPPCPRADSRCALLEYDLEETTVLSDVTYCLKVYISGAGKVVSAAIVAD